MSNTTTKVNSFICMGYSLLASQENLNNPEVPAAEEFDTTEIPSYQDMTKENILPNTQSVMQTIVPLNPNVLKI